MAMLPMTPLIVVRTVAIHLQMAVTGPLCTPRLLADLWKMAEEEKFTSTLSWTAPALGQLYGNVA